MGVGLFNNEYGFEVFERNATINISKTDYQLSEIRNIDNKLFHHNILQFRFIATFFQC